MRIVIIGGTGRIGSRVVKHLREQRHQAVPASPDTGVNTLTGEGLAEVLAGAAAVVDVSNSPSFEDAAVRADARLGEIRFEDWLAQAAVPAAPA